MKKLMLIGGIISMVLPAMANTNLSDYDLKSGTGNTCSSNLDGYEGFTTGNVTMAPLYVKKCTNGQYYNATADAINDVEAEPANYTWSNGQCLDGSDPISTITSEEECNNAVKYYSLDVCDSVENYEPSEGAHFAKAAEPRVEGGILYSTTPALCPVGYRDGTDGDHSYESNCYKNCITVASQTMEDLKATSAEYSSSKAHYDTQEFQNSNCLVEITGCASGYDPVDLRTWTLNSCSLNDGPTPVESCDWSLVSGENTIGGTLSCSAAGACIATLTGSGEQFVIEDFSDSGYDKCVSECGRNAATAIPVGISTVLNGNVPSAGVYCAAKTVNITYTDYGTDSCEYGSSLSVPAMADKTNENGTYKFIGWTVKTVD